MKITIVGAGNAGCFTALHYAMFTRHIDCEVELVHNPDILPEPVGQATFPNEPELLDNALGFNWHNNFIHATPKTGILYEGWGKKNKSFFHPFPADSVGLHLCPVELQREILQSGLFKVRESNVLDPKDVDADYVFDCRGRPDDLTDYDDLINPLNAAIIARPNWDTGKTLWTRTVATPDGWTFIIPTHFYSQSRGGSAGYLYNSDITSKEEAENNFQDQFDVDVREAKYINFKSYIAKNPVVDGRIFLNGNRLFFLEPLEATAIHTSLQWARECFTVSVIKERTTQDIVKYIRKHINEIQNFILWHYQFGSKYDTPFWDYAKTLADNTSKDMKFDILLQQVDGMSLEDIKFGEMVSNNPDYGAWHRSSMKNWISGVTKTL